jgi:hypothetical protein
MKVLAVLLIILSVVIAIVPQFFNCQHDGKALLLEDGREVPMKCYWTSRVAFAVAVPIFVVGIMLTFNRSAETRRALAILVGILGLVVVLLPTSIIGVCMHPGASCNLVMKPTLIFSGILVIAVSLFLGAVSKERKG